MEQFPLNLAGGSGIIISLPGIHARHTPLDENGHIGTDIRETASV